MTQVSSLASGDIQVHELWRSQKLEAVYVETRCLLQRLGPLGVQHISQNKHKKKAMLKTSSESDK